MCGTGLSFYLVLNTLTLSMVARTPSMGGEKVMRQTFLLNLEIGFLCINVNFLKVFNHVPALLLWYIKHTLK